MVRFVILAISFKVYNQKTTKATLLFSGGCLCGIQLMLLIISILNYLLLTLLNQGHFSEFGVCSGSQAVDVHAGG
jgi:hypothetical protein